jgi:hypothetical protein
MSLGYATCTRKQNGVYLTTYNVTGLAVIDLCLQKMNVITSGVYQILKNPFWKLELFLFSSGMHM